MWSMCLKHGCLSRSFSFAQAEAKYIAECNARSEERMRKRKLENEEREEREKAEKAKEEEERKVRQEKERKEREERERERKERAALEPQEPLQTAADDDDDVEMQDMNAGNEVSSASTSPPGGLSVSREQSLDTTAADIAVDEVRLSMRWVYAFAQERVNIKTNIGKYLCAFKCLGTYGHMVLNTKILECIRIIIHICI